MSDSSKSFLYLWAVLIILNQVLFFNTCFKIHCILNALPHTVILTALIMAFISDRNK